MHKLLRRLIFLVANSVCLHVTTYSKKRPGCPPILTQAQIKDHVAYVCMSARNRSLSFQQLAQELDFRVGKSAIG